MFDQLTAFHFLRPQWLGLLVPAGLLYLAVLRQEDASKRWQEIIAPELLEKLLVRRRSGWRFRPVHAACLTLILGSLGMAGPTWTREKPPFTEDKAPLVIALDLSREMDAIDVQPTRIERAKLKVHDLMNIRQGSRTALFVYASDAHLVTPLTSDSSLMDLYAQSLSTSLISPAPKNTAAALRKIDAFLRSETVPGTIVFITCGIERRAFPAFAQHAGNLRRQILILGVGTSQGGPLRDASGQFVTDAGRRIFSKLDLDGLKALRDQADVPVSTITLDDDDVKWVQRRAVSHLQAVQQSDARVRWVDQGYWLVLPIALLSAVWFRKGWTIPWITVAIAVLLPFNAAPASAGEFHFVDLWLTRDQQGRYYYERGDYPSAAKLFRDPSWKGLALCRQQDYAGAIDEFALVDTPESWFNQGNALAHLHKYPEAIQDYTEALRQRPHWREAEDNLALVRSLIPPRKKLDQQEQSLDEPPDQIKFDEKGKKGKIRKGFFSKEEMADVWMRNIQVSPADFLRRKFAIESATERAKPPARQKQ